MILDPYFFVCEQILTASKHNNTNIWSFYKIQVKANPSYYGIPYGYTQWANLKRKIKPTYIHASRFQLLLLQPETRNSAPNQYHH
jgi:hypothetical protein